MVCMHILTFGGISIHSRAGRKKLFFDLLMGLNEKRCTYISIIRWPSFIQLEKYFLNPQPYWKSDFYVIKRLNPHNTPFFPVTILRHGLISNHFICAWNICKINLRLINRYLTNPHRLSIYVFRRKFEHL